MSSTPFTSKYYTSFDGLKLHYRDYPGPAAPRFTVVCIPGLTRNARDFEDLAPHLAETYRVICVELRGRGQSEYAKDPATYVPPIYVQDVRDLFKAAGLSRAALIGTSLGGIISMILGAVEPAKILGVVINDIGPEINPGGLARIGGYVGKAKSVTNWEDAATVIKAIDGHIFPDYTDDDWHRMARRRFVETPEGGLRADYDLDISKPFADSTAAVDLWPFFARLKRMPALAIRGAETDLLTPEVFARMKDAVPGLRQVTVPGRGHAPALDEPVALAAIDEFLRNLPADIGPIETARRTIAAAMFMARLKLKGIA